MYTSNLAVKLDLASIKAHVIELAADKLKIVPDLSQLSNVVDNDDVKKRVYDNK